MDRTPRRRRASAVMALLLLGCSAQADEATSSDPREATLHLVLQRAQRDALDADHVDWPKVSAAAERQLAEQPGEAGLTTAIRGVIAALGNRHTFYLPPRKPKGQQPGAPKKPVAWTSPPIATTSRTDAGTPVLAIHAWMGATVRTDLHPPALQARAGLVAAMEAPSCGLILDLRGNRGGNMWPMVWGVAPLLPLQQLGAFVDRSGASKPVILTSQGIRIGGHLDRRLPPSPGPQPAHLPRYFAMFQDARTGSSGEATAILFKGQENVRSFGTASAGFTTSNRPVPLPNGGTLLLTTGRTVDRNGNFHEPALVPDNVTDDAVGAAERWLAAQCRA